MGIKVWNVCEGASCSAEDSGAVLGTTGSTAPGIARLDSEYLLAAYGDPGVGGSELKLTLLDGMYAPEMEGELVVNYPGTLVETQVIAREVDGEVVAAILGRTTEELVLTTVKFCLPGSP